MNTLHRDLTRKFKVDVAAACKRHMALCEAVDIEPEEALQEMVREIGRLLVLLVCDFSKCPPEEFGAACADDLRRLREKRAGSAPSIAP